MRLFAGGLFLPEIASQTLFSLTPGEIESQAVETLGPLAKYSALIGAVVANIILYGLISLLSIGAGSFNRTRSNGYIINAIQSSVLAYVILLFVGLILFALVEADVQTKISSIATLSIHLILPAKVKIQIEYLDDDKDKAFRPYPVELTYKLNENNLDVIDKIEHLPITKDYVKLNKEQIEQLKIIDKRTRTNDSRTELFIWSDNNPMVLVNMKTISENGNVLCSVEKYVFSVSKDNNDSLSDAKKLQCFNCNTGETDYYETSIHDNFKPNPLLLDLVKSLAILHLHSGIPFKLPEHLTDEDFISLIRQVKEIAEIIQTKTLIHRPIVIKIPKKLALSMVEDYMYNKIKDNLLINLPFTCSILGKKIMIREATLDLSKIKPRENLTELFKKIIDSDEQLIEIEFNDYK